VARPDRLADNRGSSADDLAPPPSMPGALGDQNDAAAEHEPEPTGPGREPRPVADVSAPPRTSPALDEVIAILARGVQRAIEAAAASPRAKSGP
jgi:hypothetical protein